MELSRQPALSGYCGDGEQLPASSDKADRRAYIRRHAQTLFHPVGTCAMGPDEDAVVDVELRVRGVDGLRVVDDVGGCRASRAGTRMRPRSRLPSARRI